MGGNVQIFGKINDTNDQDRQLRADSSTESLQVIDYPHHEIHSGNSYFLTYGATVGDGANLEIRIGTPNTTKWAHMELNVEATGQTDIDLYEDTTVTHSSDVILTKNRNRNSSNTSGLTICHTPTGSGDGTILAMEIFGLDTGTGATRRLSGGEAGGRAELILKQNSAYLLRVTSATAGNRVMVILSWYEHTEKN